MGCSRASDRPRTKSNGDIESGPIKVWGCLLMGWSGRVPAPPVTNLARGSKDKGAPGVVTKCLQLPTEMMRTDASFHADQARRHVG